MIAPLPANEAARLDALRSFAVLDTAPESDFDDLTRLAATICGTPIALVSLVDTCRQWFKSRHGIDATETHRDAAFCAHAILGDGLFEVPDTASDARFRDNPLVTGEPRIRFYAGMPLVTPDGHGMGTLCVIDRTPRALTDEQRDALAVLARQVVAQLVLRRQVRRLREAEAERRAADRKFRAIFDATYEYIGLLSPDGTLLEANRTSLAGAGVAAEDVLGRRFWECVWWAHNPALQVLLRDGIRLAAGGEFVRFEADHPLSDGTLAAIDFSLTPIRDDTGAVTYLVPEGRDVTGRKRAEDVLRESEEEFRKTIDELAEGVVLLDFETRAVVRANRAFRDMLGYTAEEVTLVTQYQFVAHARADVDAHMRRVVERGRHDLGYRKYRRKDGSVLDVSVSGGVLSQGGRAVLSLVVRDMTVEKAAEDALRASEELLRRAFDGAAIGMALVSPDGRWIRVNRAVCELLGYAPDDLLATDFQTITHPDDLGADLQLVGQVLAGEIATYQMEKRYFHKGGAVVHVLLSVSLVRDSAGGPRYFVSQIEDITARKAAEDALRDSEAKFRDIVNRLGEGLFVVDPATRRFVEANAAILTMLGYTAVEFFARTPDDIAAVEPPEVVSRNVAAIDDALARRGHCDLGRKHYRRKDGTAVPVEVRVTLIPDGRAGLHAVIVRDLTEQVAAEDRLFEYQCGLEEANAKLQALAVTDALTGVNNRGAFNGRLAEEVDRASRHGRPLSILLMDVDHFKAFNDTFGHPAGDEVLIAVAATLRKTARTTDFVARYGGEEFVVLLPDTDYAGAMVLAERCRRAIAGQPWDRRPVTVSVGVATLADGATDGSALVREADEALYKSKAAGRNRIHFGSGATLMAAARRTLAGQPG